MILDEAPNLRCNFGAIPSHQQCLADCPASRSVTILTLPKPETITDTELQIRSADRMPEADGARLTSQYPAIVDQDRHSRGHSCNVKSSEPRGNRVRYGCSSRASLWRPRVVDRQHNRTLCRCMRCARVREWSKWCVWLEAGLRLRIARGQHDSS
jgi:hypothetical protein